MNRTIVKMINNKYFKIIFGVIILSIGVLGGVYVGYDFSGKKAYVYAKTNAVEHNYPDEYSANLKIDSLFPDNNFIDSKGGTNSFNNLIIGKNTIILYMSFDCEACIEYYEFFEKSIIPILNEDFQIVICVDKNIYDLNIVNKYKFIVQNKEVAFIDFDLYQDKYNLFMKPTTILLDKKGHIKYIELGFERSIRNKIIEIYDF